MSTSSNQKVTEEGAEQSALSEMLKRLLLKLHKSPRDKMVRPEQVKMK